MSTAPDNQSAVGTRIPTLDGLRGCAVLLVLIGHDIGMSPLLDGPPESAQSYFRAALGLSVTGVDLFFVLSGFLIGGILLDHRDSPQLIRAFYVRRFLRIVPLAWLVIALSLLIHHVTREALPPAIPWWVGFSFTTNIFLAVANGWMLTPLTAHWSLAIEEQFYLFFPWIVRRWPPLMMMWLGPGLIAGALVSRLVIYFFAPDHLFACHMLTFCRLDALGAGFFAAWLVRSDGWGQFSKNRRLLWSALFVLSIGFVVLLKCQFRAPDQMNLWGYTLVALFYGIALLLVYQPKEKWVQLLFGSRLLTTYGKFSYFLYLFQLLLTAPLIALLFHGRWTYDAPSNWWEIIVSLVVLLPLAALSWYFFEAPIIRLGHRWRYGLARSTDTSGDMSVNQKATISEVSAKVE